MDNKIPNDQGTPKTLRDAIAFSLCTATKSTFDQNITHMKAVIQDFLAQRFQTSMVKHENECDKFLELFNSIIADEKQRGENK